MLVLFKTLKLSYFLLEVESNCQLSLLKTKKGKYLEAKNLIVIRPELVLLPALKASYVLQKRSALNLEEMRCQISLKFFKQYHHWRKI